MMMMMMMLLTWMSILLASDGDLRQRVSMS